MRISRRQVLSTLSMTALAVGHSAASEDAAPRHLGGHDHSELEQPPPPTTGRIVLRASGMTAAVQMQDGTGKTQGLDFGLVEVSARKHYPTLTVPRNMIAPGEMGVTPDAVTDENAIWNLTGRNVEVISVVAKPIVVNETPLTQALVAAGEYSTIAQFATLDWAMDLEAIGGKPIVADWRAAATTAAVVRVSSGATVEPSYTAPVADEDKAPGRYMLSPDPSKKDRVYKDAIRVAWTTTHVTLRFTSRAKPGVELGKVIARYRPGHSATIRVANFPADWLHRNPGVKQTDVQAHAALIGVAPANLRIPEFVRHMSGGRAAGCDCCLVPRLRERMTGAALPSL